jgi:hypothetical protein
MRRGGENKVEVEDPELEHAVLRRHQVALQGAWQRCPITTHRSPVVEENLGPMSGGGRSRRNADRPRDPAGFGEQSITHSVPNSGPGAGAGGPGEVGLRSAAKFS